MILPECSFSVIFQPRVAKTPRSRIHNKAVAVAAREDAPFDDDMLVDELRGDGSGEDVDEGSSNIPHKSSKADKKVRHVVQSKLPGELPARFVLADRRSD